MNGKLKFYITNKRKENESIEKLGKGKKNNGGDVASVGQS